jgi:hypothetical protein
MNQSPAFDYIGGIETFYQKKVEEAGEFADCVEAKEVWWEYHELLEAEAADHMAESSIPAEIYALKNSWI